MNVGAAILGLAVLVIAVTDAFQTVVVARHAHKLPALTRLFYRLTWTPFSSVMARVRSEERRDRYVGIYGPIALLLLLALWAFTLIMAFAFLQWSIELQRNGEQSSFSYAIYFSAATFFTLGPGEPENIASRYLMVLEAGLGFSFLGLVISYLPVLYQSFSSREVHILLLDARAGSPPSAAQLIRRGGSDPAVLEKWLAAWEAWALDLLQSHLSYPMLAFYRSQHHNQSWLSALTTVVDVSALVMVSGDDRLKRQAEFTFAAGRHALVHTASVFQMRPGDLQVDRLPADDFSRLRDAIAAGGTSLSLNLIVEEELARLRTSYEPYASMLGRYFLMPLPPWLPTKATADNWQVSSWER
jgi:hypothetical protein